MISTGLFLGIFSWSFFIVIVRKYSCFKLSLSFLNVRADTAPEMISQISTALREEYTRYYPFISEGTVPDEQSDRRQEREPGTVCPALPSALSGVAGEPEAER